MGGYTTNDSVNAETKVTGEAVVEFSHVCKKFLKSQTIALNDISFIALKGKITGLIGPDAAGKTTLIRIAVGLMVPDSGTIKVLGKDASLQSLEIQSEVAYMPQRFGLFEDLTTQEICMQTCKVYLKI